MCTHKCANKYTLEYAYSVLLLILKAREGLAHAFKGSRQKHHKLEVRLDDKKVTGLSLKKRKIVKEILLIILTSNPGSMIINWKGLGSE